jgi:hypothetical protein
MSAWRSVGRRPQTMVACAIALTLYLCVLLAEPFLHHSAACHANTPTHCTACQLQMTSPDVQDAGLTEIITALPDAGAPLADTHRADRAPVVTRTKDRSPPLA